MKTLKKTLAIFLVLLTCVSLFSAAAFAEDAEKADRLQLVCIGNESTSGLGLPGYGASTASGKWSDSYSGRGASFGFLDNLSNKSYVYSLASYMNTLDGGRGVELTNLSLEGMRTDELRGILQPDFAKLAAEKGEKGDTYFAERMKAYNAWFADSKNKKGVGNKSITDFFSDAIANADVITLDLTASNAETYLLNRLQAVFGIGKYSKADYSESASDLKYELDFDVASYEETATRLIKSYVSDNSGLSADAVNGIVSAVAYCYCDFIVNFTKDMEFLLKLKENPGSYRITSAQSKGLRRFLRKEYLNKVTGETVNSSDLMPMIDDGKLNEFNELMGYYQIVTSELEMDDREVIEKYHGLTQIEDQFREMKGTLETRPVFVQTPEHIKAHLMVCFMALTMIRVVQRKTRQVVKPPKEDSKWSYGIPGARISDALAGWQVVEFPGEYYQVLKAKGDDIFAILKAFGMELKPQLYTRGEIREMKATASPF